MKFDLQRVSIWVNIQKKFQVPRSHSIGEKCDANFKLSSHFSRKVCDWETWNLICKEYPYGLIYKKNFKFLGRTVSEKSAMLISSCYHRIFLEKCATEKHEIWFSKEYPYGLMYKKNFKFLGRTVSEKNAMTIVTCKISKLICKEYLRTVCATLNFCKLSSHFSRKLCDRETWNLICKEYPYGLIYKKNFKFLGRTVSEKNAMLTCKISKLFIRTIVQLWIFASYHRIFLEKCATEKHEIWFAKSIHMG